jgi:uncharacterized membrane protein
MTAIVGFSLAVFVLSIIVGAIGVLYESEGWTEWQRRAGGYWVRVATWGMRVSFASAAVAAICQIIRS